MAAGKRDSASPLMRREAACRLNRLMKKNALSKKRNHASSVILDFGTEMQVRQEPASGAAPGSTT